jgi:hypothetical protein
LTGARVGFVVRRPKPFPPRPCIIGCERSCAEPAVVAGRAGVMVFRESTSTVPARLLNL